MSGADKKRNKSLKYKADIEFFFNFLKINASINTLLIILIFIRMLHSTFKPNWEIVASIVWYVK